jgi:hypothetical protein
MGTTSPEVNATLHTGQLPAPEAFDASSAGELESAAAEAEAEAAAEASPDGESRVASSAFLDIMWPHVQRPTN